MNKLRDSILKLPRKIYWILFLLFLLIDAIAFDFSSLLQKIEIWDIAAAYNSLVSIYPQITQLAHNLKYLLLLLTIIDACLLIYKPRLILLSQTSFSPDLADIEVDLHKKYHIDEIRLDQSDKIINFIPSETAIEVQDDKVVDILKKRKSTLLCYYGIAHTPLVFRLGFKIGDQSNIKLLHKRRTNDSVFMEWSHELGTLTIDVEESNKSIKSNEMIVAISTSLKIMKQNLKVLHPEDKHIVFFESSNLGFDCITSYVTAEYARNFIMQKLRDLVKKYDIQKIHLVISSSVAFTFFLAQAFSPQHEPITVVYHYQNGTYPWGVCMNDNARSALVKAREYKT